MENNLTETSYAYNLVVELLDKIHDASDSADISGLPTGFSGIDEITSGLQVGNLVAIASRPSIGKSTFAINIAEHVSINEGLPVIIFSMESSQIEIMMRMVASNGRIYKSHLENGRLYDEEWPRLVESIEKIRASAPIQIHNPSPKVDISYLREKIIKFKEECGAVPLIVVDCLQMMNGDPRENLIELKAMANDFGCSVVITSQIGGKLDFRNDKRPSMFDIRETPGMEYIPDILMLLYRDEYYTEEASKEPGVAEVNIIRNRMGKTGVVKLTFIKNVYRFENRLE